MKCPFGLSVNYCELFFIVVSLSRILPPSYDIHPTRPYLCIVLIKSSVALRWSTHLVKNKVI